MGIVEIITKVFDFFSKAKSYFHETINEFESRITKKIEQIQKKIILTFIQGLFFALGFVAILWAFGLFLGRFFPSEIVLLFIAFIFVYTAIIIGFFKK